jgi:hypothetical protein
LVEEVDVEETRLKHHHNFFQKMKSATVITQPPLHYFVITDKVGIHTNHHIIKDELE